MYGFCIGNGHTGEKLPETRVGNMQKLNENDGFCMNGVFRGAFGSKIGSNWSKTYAGCDYNIRFQPNPCFWVVLKDFDFHKNQFFLHIFSQQSKQKPLYCMGTRTGTVTATGSTAQPVKVFAGRKATCAVLSDGSATFR